MIEQYHFGSMTISGKRYTTDLKIIEGQVIPDWWRKSGHIVEINDITDILKAKPKYLIIGTGSSGLMKVENKLQQHLLICGIHLMEESTAKATQTFNQMHQDGKNISACFHLTC